MNLLQTSFLINMRTGNIFFDTIISIIVLTIISYLTANYKYIIDKLKDICRQDKNVKSEYLIQGKVTTSLEFCNHYTYFPDEYRAIMFKLHTMSIDIKRGKKFNTNSRFNNNNNDKGKKSYDYFSYSINNNKRINVNEYIWVIQENNVNKSNDLKSAVEIYNLYVYSNYYNFIEIKNIIDEWKKEYKIFIKEYNDGNYYFFSYVGKNKIKKDNSIVKAPVISFDSHIFSSNKTFNNIFFEDKQKLLERIDWFINNENNYKRLGIPYTLGLMFTGEPGCGKTSTIKAIANYTKRHIIEIPLSRVTTCRELKEIFFNEIINDHYVPSNKKIIVLEDIDCMGNIVKNRQIELVDTKAKEALLCEQYSDAFQNQPAT